ncbi:MAG: alpha-amylase family glycosyl hydrolase [Chitinophagales bacterium]
MPKFLITLAVLSSIIICSCKYLAKENAETKMEARNVPAVDDIVIYEIFVRNFTVAGTFKAIIPHLDRIKSLGVNVIWLMPIQPVGKEKHKGTYGSPYAIQNYTEVHPEFGTKSDFKNLVDSVHAKGMYLIIDEVANHTAWDNPWVKDHPDWYTHDSVTKKIIPPVTDWSDVADLNFDNADLRKEVIHDMKYWIDSFNIDGFRCDAAAMVPNDFWKECISMLRQSRPLLMLAESDDPKMYENGFDITYGWYMYSVLKNVWKGDSTTAAVQRCLQSEATRFPANYKAVRFITNHDEDSWDDVPEVKFINRDGARAAFITMITLPGIPLIYNGQEVGYPTKINLFEKYSIDWSANPELHQWYQTIVNFYNNNMVLKKGTLDQFDFQNENVLIYQRKILGNDPLWIMVNTSNLEVTAKLPVTLQNKKLKDVLSSEGIASAEVMKLRPFEYHILEVK